MKDCDKSNTETWDIIIKPFSGFSPFIFKEIWSYRDLIYQLVKRDFVAQYKQTILGPLWFIIQPLLYSLVFTVVFGNIAKMSTEGKPPFMFYMAGNVVWQFFSLCLVKSSSTFIDSAGIFRKVYFPRMVIPISSMISNLMQFTVQFALFLVFLAYFYFIGANIKPNIAILTLPLLIIIIAGTGLGFGLIISTATVKYRDLRYLVVFSVNLLMYVTPIIYPLSSVPTKWRWLMEMNPMSAVVEVFRYSFLGEGTISLQHILLTIVITLIIFVVGVFVFNRAEKTAMDTV